MEFVPVERCSSELRTAGTAGTRDPLREMDSNVIVPAYITGLSPSSAEVRRQHRPRVREIRLTRVADAADSPELDPHLRRHTVGRPVTVWVLAKAIVIVAAGTAVRERRKLGEEPLTTANTHEPRVRYIERCASSDSPSEEDQRACRELNPRSSFMVARLGRGRTVHS